MGKQEEKNEKNEYEQSWQRRGGPKIELKIADDKPNSTKSMEPARAVGI